MTTESTTYPASYTPEQIERIERIKAQLLDHKISDGKLCDTKKDGAMSFSMSQESWSLVRNGNWPGNPKNVIAAVEKRLAWLLNPVKDGVKPRGKLAFFSHPIYRQIQQACAQAALNAIGRLDASDGESESLVFAVMPPGWGKSVAAKHLAATFGGKTVLLTGNATWTRGAKSFFMQVAEALGVACERSKWSACTVAEINLAILKHLAANPTLVIFDEGLEVSRTEGRHITSFLRDIAVHTTSAVCVFLLPSAFDAMAKHLSAEHLEQDFRRAPIIEAKKTGVSISWATRMAGHFLALPEAEAKPLGKYLASEGSQRGGLALVAGVLTILRDEPLVKLDGIERPRLASEAVDQWRTLHRMPAATA